MLYPAVRKRLVLLLVLPALACGSVPDPGAYRCVKSIVGPNESGGVIASAGSVAFVGGFDTISVFDLANPASPTPLPSLPYPFPVLGLAVSGSQMVVTSGQTLAVYDVSNPRAAKKLGELSSGAPSSSALVTDGHWAYTGFSGNVVVYDLTGSVPKLVTQFGGLPQVITSLALLGSALYVGGAVPKSLAVFDVTSPAQPQPMPSVDVKGYIEALTLDNGALFAFTLETSGDPRAQRFDLSAPLAPKLTARSTDVCGCSASPVTVQTTALHGHFLAPQVKSVGGWPEEKIATSSAGVGGLCLPEEYTIVHVHSVGDVVVISGQAAIGFLAP